MPSVDVFPNVDIDPKGVSGMHRIVIRRATVVVLSTLMVTFFGVHAPAWSAAPFNDDRSSPLIIADPLPKTVTVDTTNATASPTDPGDEQCSGSTMGATSWVPYSPALSRYIVVHHGLPDRHRGV